MDVYESKKALDTTTENKNVREVSSRYKSPIPNGPKRCPNTSKTLSTSTVLVPKRAISAERNHPSTMRSLNVSFQYETILLPVSTKEKEKSVDHTPLDPTSRKPTSENSRPLNALHARKVDQNRWPSVKTSSSQNRIISFSDKTSKTSCTHSLRRLSLDGACSNTLQPQNSTSVLSFIADVRKGQKAANQIEDVHQLRMLYNRHLQWRYANARTNVVLRSRKLKAEKLLYNVWRKIAGLWDSIVDKRFELQQLRLKLKLYSVLNNETTFLDKWTTIERDHTNSLTSAIRDLQTSTLRVPVTAGAKGDIEAVKASVCSAVDVMKATGSSLCSIISEVERTNSLISELAHVAAQERAMLGECESRLISTIALQVEENSLRTNLLQMKYRLLRQFNIVPNMMDTNNLSFASSFR